MITNYPYRKDNFIRSPEARKLGKEDFYKVYYEQSIEAMRAVREMNANIEIVVYTGASTGDDADPSTRIVNNIIIGSGADKIVYKSNNVEIGVEKIYDSLVQAIASRSSSLKGA